MELPTQHAMATKNDTRIMLELMLIASVLALAAEIVYWYVIPAIKYLYIAVSAALD